MRPLPQYRLRRTGRDEWLDPCANPTDEAREAETFPSATEACLFALTHVEQPALYEWERCAESAPPCHRRIA